MLDSMRKNQDNLIYTGIILAVIVVMGFYGVGQMGKSGGQSGGVAAWVNGDAISMGDFKQALERKTYQYKSLLGGQFDDKFLEQFQIPQRTLNDLIQYKLLSQQASKMGIVVPDFELADLIRTTPYFQKDGKFDAEDYAKLPNRGALEEMQREQMQVGKLQSYISDRIRPTPQELKTAYDLRDTKIDLQYAKIDFKDLAKKQKPTAKDLEAFLKNTPETEFQSYFTAHQKDFTTPAGVQIKQIRVGIPYQATPEKKQEAHKKIEAIAKEVTPSNFSQLAKAKSDDEYAKKGGEVGWVNRGTLEPSLENAISKLDLGAVSPVIETTFGYYIIQLDKKREAVTKTLAEAKKEIEPKLFAEKHEKDFIEAKHTEWDKLLAEGKNLEPELKKAGVDLKKTGPFAVGQGQIPGMGPADPLLNAVFELSKSQPTAKKLTPYQEQFYYLKLASIDFAKPADFDKNQDGIEKNLATTYQSDIMNQWVATLQKQATIKIEIPLTGPKSPVMEN